jgi:hypothetical protein
VETAAPVTCSRETRFFPLKFIFTLPVVPYVSDTIQRELTARASQDDRTAFSRRANFTKSNQLSAAGFMIRFGEIPNPSYFMNARSLNVFPRATLGGILLTVFAVPSFAAVQVFTVDTNQSSITISGTVLGGTITNQGPKSLTTTFGGTLRAALTGSSLQCSGQSQILAQTNGSWQPKADGSAGAEPADFGAQASLTIASGFAALRNVQLDVISPTLAITAGKFDSSSLTFLFPTNASSSLAYNVTGLISKHGTLALTGYATNKVTTLSSITTAGNQQVLTIPVDATFFLTLLSANDTVIHLQGKLVAVQSTQAAFQIQSLGVSGQNLVLQGQAAPGQQLKVQSSADLNGWSNSATIVTPPSGTYSWTGALTGPLGFFRLSK